MASVIIIFAIVIIITICFTVTSGVMATTELFCFCLITKNKFYYTEICVIIAINLPPNGQLQLK